MTHSRWTRSLLVLAMIAVSGGAAPAGGAPAIHAYFFDAPSCPRCEAAKALLDEALETRPQVTLTTIDVLEPSGFELAESLLDVAGIERSRVAYAPGMLVGGTYLDPGGMTWPDDISAALDDCAISGSPDLIAMAEELPEHTLEAVPEPLRNWSIASIVGAGLLDGINPCAFATLVFFLAYLGAGGMSGRRMLLVGLLFAAGVFVIYFAFGLGTLHALLVLEAFPVVRQCLYGLIAIVWLVLAGVSLQDYRRLLAGDAAGVRLQLPGIAKQRAHQAIRQALRSSLVAPAAFAAGAVVSVMEIACTGQVYVPALIYMSSISETRSAAIGWLLLYDLMFIAPLLCLLGLSLAGASSKRLAKLAERQAGRTKLLMAVFFVLCAAFFASRALGL